MLSQLNELAKNYEYLINAVGAFVPFIITIIMAYIAYQQWYLNKRNITVDMYNKYDDECFDKLKKHLSNIGTKLIEKYLLKENLNLDLEIKNDVDKISKLLKKYPYISDEHIKELIDYSFDELCNLEEIKNCEISILDSKNGYKKLCWKLLSGCIPETYRFSVLPKRTLNIYAICPLIIKSLYRFLIPYKIQDFNSKINIKIAMYLFIFDLGYKNVKKIIVDAFAKDKKDKENAK